MAWTAELPYQHIQVQKKKYQKKKSKNQIKIDRDPCPGPLLQLPQSDHTVGHGNHSIKASDQILSRWSNARRLVCSSS